MDLNPSVFEACSDKYRQERVAKSQVFQNRERLWKEIETKAMKNPNARLVSDQHSPLPKRRESMRTLCVCVCVCVCEEREILFFPPLPFFLSPFLFSSVIPSALPLLSLTLFSLSPCCRRGRAGGHRVCAAQRQHGRPHAQEHQDAPQVVPSPRRVRHECGCGV
jgi:hypothetical protein